MGHSVDRTVISLVWSRDTSLCAESGSIPDGDMLQEYLAVEASFCID